MTSLVIQCLTRFMFFAKLLGKSKRQAIKDQSLITTARSQALLDEFYNLNHNRKLNYRSNVIIRTLLKDLQAEIIAAIKLEKKLTFIYEIKSVLSQQRSGSPMLLKMLFID